ncbi:MAG: hypothetical protein HQK52_22720 [Oligoflexia bacterium]|nr:hypothetical protein [Oligoflexia bacterium]
MIIRSNSKDIALKLDALMIKHVPFVFSKTLNELAKQSQQAIVKDLQDKLTIRKNWLAESGKFGVRVRYSSKHSLQAHCL